MINSLADAMPFSRLMGLEITTASADEIHGEIVVREGLCTTGSIMHGGAIMALSYLYPKGSREPRR